MYNSIQEVYDEIIAAKNAKAELAGLTSGSATAIWRLWTWIVAAAIYTFDKLIEVHKTEIDTKLSARLTAGIDWYAELILKFQLGDVVVILNGKAQYAVVDTTKQIIKKVSVVSSAGTLVIKVAKEVAGELVKLTNEELLAVTAYLNKTQYAGVFTQIQSMDADLFKPKHNIYYDAQIPLATMKTNVNAAIINFTKTFNNENFNGQFAAIKYVDDLQKVAGVKDVENLQLLFKSTSMLSFVNITRVYSPESGYIKIDPSYDLNNLTNINYIPQ